MGITDEKLRDKRFRKTERAIIEALFGSGKILNVRNIVRRAKISRPTLYRHHKVIYEIVSDYEDYILKKYSRFVRGLTKKNDVTVRVVYLQILIFILKNENIFKMIMKLGDIRTLEKMIEKIEFMIIEECKLPKNCGDMMNIYRKEISGVMEKWIKNGFSEDETEVLRDILYLTRTMRTRLSPMMK